MPSDAYIKAASADNREPVIHLALESIDAIKRQVTTQADWNASKSISDGLRTDLEPQSVRMEHAIYPWLLGDESKYVSQMVSPELETWITQVVGPFYFSGVYTGMAETWLPQSSAPWNPGHARVIFRSSFTGPIIGMSKDFPSPSTGMFSARYCPTVVPVIPFLATPGMSMIAYVEDDASTPTFVGRYMAVFVTALLLNDAGPAAMPPVEATLVTGTLQTKTIDLGLVPNVDTRVTFDDLIPYPASIAITARGSDNETDWTDIGTVTNGTDIAPYRYYDFTAVMTSNGAHPILREIAVQGGDAQYLHFSTHRDLPVIGALPLIVPGSVGTLSTKLDLMKTPTTAEINLALFWTAATGDLIATGYPKNKIARIRHGYVGIAESDYEPLLEGRFYDYDADPVKMQIGVKFRDVRQMYAKRKLPEETYQAATGAKATNPIIYDDVHAFDVLLDLYDRIGIPGHYIGDFNTVRTADRSGTEWNIARTISSPEEAETLINEIAVTCGIILSPQPDGTVAPIVLDPEAEPVAIFDTSDVTLSKFDGGQKELFTRSMVYYDPLTSDPGESEENYQRLYIVENEAARIAWGESSEKRWFDKWDASETARTALAERMKDWYSVPRMKLTISDVAPRHMGVRLGELVQIDNLRLPVASAEWPGIVAGRKFLVVSRDFDPKNGTLKIGLSETGTVGTPGAGVAGTTLAISGADTPTGTDNLYTVTGGTAPYTWSTTVGVLSNTTGSSVSLNVSNATGDGSISVSDATAKVVKRISVAPPAVTNFFVSQQPDGTRQFSWIALSVVNIAGYAIRYSVGTGGSWDTMLPLHSGVISTSPWETNQLGTGTYTFAIRAVTTMGTLSGNATYIEATLTEQRGDYKVAQEDPRELDWPGTLTDCRVDENNYLVPTDPTTWADLTTWAAAAEWSPSPDSPIIYEHSAIDIGAVTAFTPVIVIVADGTVTLEMSSSTNGTDYSAWAANGFVASARYFKQRITVTGTRPIIYALEVTLSGKPVETTVEDLNTATLTGSHRLGTGDVRLPIAGFQVVRVIILSLQNVGQGWSWEIIDKDTTVGPRIKIYNAAGALADATIDAYIKGL